MLLTIKRKVGKDWKGVPVNEVAGTTLYKWILNSKDEVVAVLKDDEGKEIAFVSNEDEWVEKYKERAFSINAADLKELMGERDEAGVLLHIFPDAEILEVKVEKAPE